LAIRAGKGRRRVQFRWLSKATQIAAKPVADFPAIG
jgi:hypothetical protein